MLLGIIVNNINSYSVHRVILNMFFARFVFLWKWINVKYILCLFLYTFIWIISTRSQLDLDMVNQSIFNNSSANDILRSMSDLIIAEFVRNFLTRVNIGISITNLGLCTAASFRLAKWSLYRIEIERHKKSVGFVIHFYINIYKGDRHMQAVFDQY